MYFTIIILEIIVPFYFDLINYSTSKKKGENSESIVEEFFSSMYIKTLNYQIVNDIVSK